MKSIDKIEISEEFFPTWFKQRRRKWICPVCNRQHHKEPGPFFYGMIANKDEDPNDPLLYSGRTIAVFVKATGCCKWQQSFPYDEIKKRKTKKANIQFVLQKIFSHLPTKKRLLK
ncbi:MAG: hypothetical protein AB1432_07640 [Bacteroidota bacterium]|jgi:hypothetical protein